MLSLFIMAAGAGQRWNNHLATYKQCLTFGSETLIQRIRRQTALLACKQYLVVQAGTISPTGFTPLYVEATASLIESIEATSPYWDDKNIFLLGDVFYSQAVIDRIMRDTSNVVFFGRPWPSQFVRAGHGEMFALSFQHTWSSSMLELICQIRHRYDDQCVGNLWNLYQGAAGLRMGSSRAVYRFLRVVDDYTNDIDTPADWNARSELYERIASGELGWRGMLDRPSCYIFHAWGIVQWVFASYVGKEKLFSARKRQKRRNELIADAHTTFEG